MLRRRLQRKVTLDFETFSEIDVREVGAFKYSEHPSTEVLVLCYQMDDEERKSWIPWMDGDYIPDDLSEWAQDEDVLFEAHNAQFEYCIWRAPHLVVRHALPTIAIPRWRCTAARAAAAGLPRSLKNAAIAMRLKTRKDEDGTRLLRKFSQPRKPSKNNPSTRTFPWDEPEEFDKLVSYCDTDVATEHELAGAIPDLSEEEWRVFHMDMLINTRGIPLDVTAIKRTIPIVARIGNDLKKAVMDTTDGIAPTQVSRMLGFFKERGLVLPNLQAKTVNDTLVLKPKGLTPELERLLKMRVEAGKASVKKLIRMLLVVSRDRRARGCFLYYGAHTGRWCLAEGTLVLVRARGAVPIQAVRPGDEVWDSQEWVRCDGAEFSGVKSVIKKFGVWATPEHFVWEDKETKKRLVEAERIWRSLPPDVEPVQSVRLSHFGDVRTYDILNAGPRNRFALADGAIVSNSGKLVQPQNFTRGDYSPEELEELFQIIAMDDTGEMIEDLYPAPMTAIAGGMRGFIKPRKGKKFVVCDFSAIEARVLAWIAENTWMLEAFEKNADLYKRMASFLYKVPEDQITSSQRKFGKDLCLACLKRDTLCVTAGGLKKIQDITSEDLLWDGVEWVQSEGAIFKGVKEVISLWQSGIHLTPDHEVLCERGWLRADRITQSTMSWTSALELGASSLRRSGLRVETCGSNTTKGYATVGQKHTLWPPVSRRSSSAGTLSRRRASNVLERVLPGSGLIRSLAGLCTLLQRKVSGSVDIGSLVRTLTSSMSGYALGVGSRGTSLRGSGTPLHLDLLGAAIARPSGRAPARPTPMSTSGSETCTNGAVVQSTTHTGTASRCATNGMTSPCFSETSRSYQGTGRAQTDFNSIGSTAGRGTAEETVGSLPSKRISEIASTYDVLNCGPRNRFTVVGPHGHALIVHNCGYQLGGEGFHKNSIARGINVTLDECVIGVKTYRKANPKIVKLWSDVEYAACSAVKTCAPRTKPVLLRNLAFYVEDLWFCIRLPSGRVLRYAYPKVDRVERFGRMVDKLSYRADVQGRWVRESTYGGKLVENIVQAISRDIMVFAMFNAEKAGYVTIGTVHDELITEVPQDFGSAEELEEILRIRPEWALKAPINAEGWEGNRYRK